MSGEEMRARLVTLLRAGGEPWPAAPAPVVVADALLPVVRAIVAEELRAVAMEAPGYTIQKHGIVPTRVIEVSALRLRADALEAGS